MISAPVDTFLLTALGVLGSSWYLSRKLPLSTFPFLLVLGHTLFIVYTLLLQRPPNIFSALRIPLTLPVEHIRALLFAHALGRPLGEAELTTIGSLPEHLETLIAKLASFDARAIYVRLGHEALACVHCVTPSSYALFALPVPLLAYMREAAIVGFLASGLVRAWALALLVVAAAAEAWYALNGRVEVGRNGQATFMWHDNLWTARHLLFLALPLVLLLLPMLPHFFPLLPRFFPSIFAAPPIPAAQHPLKTLPSTLSTMEHLLTRAHLAPLLRAAIVRDPALREQAESWWRTRKEEGTWGREDTEVKRVAKGVGLGYADGEDQEQEQGRLGATVRMTVEALRYGYKSPVVVPSPSTSADSD
ncbi:hypothetical protein HWV62_12010 [Athelia sp. TMB]|nr:hypothetical protein HWV62_12010 [Athelia sp. TMB]